MSLLPPLKDVPPEVSGIRNFLVPPGIVAVARTSPPKVRKRTPWKPLADGGGTTVRPGEREWFSDRLFVEPQEGHPRSSYTTSIIVHVCIVTAFLALVVRTTPVEPLFVRQNSAVAIMFAVVAPPAAPPPPAAPSPIKERTRPVQQVGAPGPTPPPPAAGDPTAPTAPVEAPASITPETGNEGRTAGVEGGVTSGGIEGGVVGGTGRTASAPGPPGPVVVRVSATMKAPKRIKYVEPDYPAAALPSRAHGTVLIEAVIGPDGKVQDAKVLASMPLFDRAALEAVRQWEYEPPRLNGAPVSVVMTVVVNFSLR